MRDKRHIDEISVEELERILVIKKREARQQKMQRMERDGRLIERPAPTVTVQVQAEPPPIAMPALTPRLAQLEQLAALAEGGATPSSVTSMTVPLPTVNAPTASAAGREVSAIPVRAPYAPQYETAHARGDDVYTVEAGSRRVKSRRKIYDRLLLLIEVAAVVGLAVIGVNLFTAIRDLEQETASAQALSDEQRRAGIPTIAPTPSLRLENYILPGGHIVQDGLPVFNYNEVPSHLRQVVESQWVQPIVSRPATTSETALLLTIPALNVSQSIVQGVDWEALRQGVGQLPNNTNPGDPTGNVVFAGHNDIYGEVFRHLRDLQPGDQFQVQTNSNNFTYTITETRIVEPDDVSVLAERGGATVTLISCYPYQVNTQRIIVFADRVA